MPDFTQYFYIFRKNFGRMLSQILAVSAWIAKFSLSISHGQQIVHILNFSQYVRNPKGWPKFGIRKSISTLASGISKSPPACRKLGSFPLNFQTYYDWHRFFEFFSICQQSQGLAEIWNQETNFCTGICHIEIATSVQKTGKFSFKFSNLLRLAPIH